MASEYGVLPTEALSQPAGAFWENAKIRAAGVAWEAEQREKAQERRQSAGAASPQEQEQLVKANEDRADARDAADSATPDFSEQVEAAGGPV